VQTDVFGRAILDYYRTKQEVNIETFSSLEEADILPVAYLFREFSSMPALEKSALKACKGSVLDIGCGAGSHSLYLVSKGYAVTALDTSPGAVTVCKERGLTDVVQIDFWRFEGRRFDTLLLLMNGIGLVGKLHKLSDFFKKIKELLHPGGQVLFDSSDIIYMFEKMSDGGYLIPADRSYYGEVSFEMHYQELKSEPFDWLYIDINTVSEAAELNGFHCDLVRKGPHYDYLAKLTLKI
jgi:cyclopropane fatty-acyl-phospholipid synthase-like methyltransferase